MTKKKTFGSCSLKKFSPKTDTISEKTKVLNCHHDYGEALKLSHSLTKAIDKISEYKMSSSEGKRASVNVAVHLSGKSKNRISVLEGKV